MIDALNVGDIYEVVRDTLYTSSKTSPQVEWQSPGYRFVVICFDNVKATVIGDNGVHRYAYTNEIKYKCDKT